MLLFPRFNLIEKRLFLLAILVYFIASFFSEGFHHFDEHFQLIEFANYKLGYIDASELSWEFHHRIRPTFQPGIIFIFYKIYHFIGFDDPFIFTFFLRLFASFLSLTGVYLFYNAFKNNIQNTSLRLWFLVLSLFTWFILYNHVRFSSESLSASLFLIGFSLIFFKQKKNHLYYFLIGCILGLSFLARFQIGFSIFGLGIWLLFINRLNFSKTFSIGFGLIIIIGLGILLDTWFYGEFTLSFWKYFEHNILLDKAASFGVSPWWSYFTLFAGSGVPPISIILIIGCITYLIFFRKAPITWVVFWFLFAHILVAHKELRFLFPMAVLTPYMTLKVIEFLNEKYKLNLVQIKTLKILFIITLSLNFLLSTIVTFRASDSRISMYKEIWRRYDTPTTLYFMENNPYLRVKNINFYKKKNLQLSKLENQTLPKSNGNTIRLIAIHYREHKQIEVTNAKEIYNTFPKWIYNFNWGDWQSRTDSYYVYELTENSRLITK